MKTLQGSWYDYPQYYDIAFQDETRMEVRFIEAAIEKYVSKPVTMLLEPGCGTGRLIHRLAKRGYRMIGYDLNERALAYARRRLRRAALSAEICVGDLTTFCLPHPVTMAYSFCNTFRHLLTEAAAQAHLRCIANSLVPGGIYLLGLHLLPPDAEPTCFERWSQTRRGTKVTVTLRVDEARAERRTEIFDICQTIVTPRQSFRLRCAFPMRTYSATQLRRLLASVDPFELLDVYDFWYDIDRPLVLDDTISDTVLVLRRRS